MAKIHKSSVFEGAIRTIGDEDALARRQLVVVHPPMSADLAWFGANTAGVTLRDLGTIETRYSENVANVHLGSVMLLEERCNPDTSGVLFKADGSTRLNEALVNIATLANMGTTSTAQAVEYNPHLDTGMAVVFPGAMAVGQTPTSPAPNV